jgi:DNA-binding transcriptional MerR regulator
MDSGYYLLSMFVKTAMKISELSQVSDVPVATIKYYIREGLLPVGERRAKNQADYGPRHVARLALIRSLRDAAGLPIETIARALHAADAAETESAVAAIDAVAPPERVPVDPSSPTFERAHALVLALAARRGWELRASDLAVRDAAHALALIAAGFGEGDAEGLVPYFEAAEMLAAHELPEGWDQGGEPEETLRYALLGTVMFEPFILAVRRMAHCARSRALSKG